MLDTKIILVEGIPGSGKSGISQFVCRQLNVVGQTAFWCHEERADHPLSLFYDPQRHKSWDGYIEEAVRQWQSFVEVLYEKDQIAVLDAALLQNHLRSMLIFNSDRQAMFDLVSRVEGSIAGLNPVFIYLRPKDIENHFRDIVALRGERMLELWIAAHDQYPFTQTLGMQGEAGFIRFWQEFSEIADQIFKNLFCSKLQQEISCSDWKVRYREVREFFELPELFGSTELSEFDRYVGEYFSQNNTLEASFRIQMGEGCLVAVVEQPTIDIEQGPIGCFREVQFLPIGKNQFDVAGWPHEVLFEEDSTGKVCRLNLRVCEAGWQTDEKIYVKR